MSGLVTCQECSGVWALESARATLPSMIPLTEILARAAKSPLVTRVGVGVIIIALTLYGVKLMFGSDVRVTTTDASDCAVNLADKTARLEMTQQALVSCSVAMDLLTAPRPTGAAHP